MQRSDEFTEMHGYDHRYLEEDNEEERYDGGENSEELGEEEDGDMMVGGNGEDEVDDGDEDAELAAAEAAALAAQQQPQPGGAFQNVGQGLIGKYKELMLEYWQETINSIENDDHDFKNHQLPLARIKKVMKTDEQVKMISAEAPILFAKGCDVFITELTMRAWIHAEENKRRTLQKSDIAAALTKSDMFDFLIDVVPRELEKPKKSFPLTRNTSNAFGPSHYNDQQQPLDHDGGVAQNGFMFQQQQDHIQLQRDLQLVQQQHHQHDPRQNQHQDQVQQPSLQFGGVGGGIPPVLSQPSTSSVTMTQLPPPPALQHLPQLTGDRHEMGGSEFNSQVIGTNYEGDY